MPNKLVYSVSHLGDIVILDDELDKLVKVASVVHLKRWKT